MNMLSSSRRWPAYNGTDDTSILLHDLAGLSQSKKVDTFVCLLSVTRWHGWASPMTFCQSTYSVTFTPATQLILPVSSWAQWAGLLSNATEIHVNMPPHHPIMPDMPQFIYHNEKTKQFFGRYSNVTMDVEFDLKTPSEPIRVAETPTTVVESALPTATPSNASSLPAQSTVVETLLLTDPMTSAPQVQVPLSITEKESLSQNFRSNGSTAAMWWWQHMRSGWSALSQKSFQAIFTSITDVSE